MKTARLEQICNLFELCAVTEQGTACNSEREKWAEAKEIILYASSPVTQIIADAIEDG